MDPLLPGWPMSEHAEMPRIGKHPGGEHSGRPFAYPSFLHLPGTAATSSDGGSSM
jgi:hypothetical protein